MSDTLLLKYQDQNSFPHSDQWLHFLFWAMKELCHRMEKCYAKWKACSSASHPFSPCPLSNFTAPLTCCYNSDTSLSTMKRDKMHLISLYLLSNSLNISTSQKWSADILKQTMWKWVSPLPHRHILPSCASLDYRTTNIIFRKQRDEELPCTLQILWMLYPLILSQQLLPESSISFLVSIEFPEYHECFHF